MRLPERVVIASKNPDKVREVEEILADAGVDPVGGLSWSDVEETGSTLAENALLKARAVAEATGLPALADDTGLEVEALGGDPGVRSARYAGPEATYRDNVEKLLGVLVGTSDRRARFRTVVALVTPEGEEMVTEGILEGAIAERPRGSYGFGYDPVFEVGGRTIGEMAPSEKHALSHRGRAVRALLEVLEG